ncbi:hypothetical protein ACFFJN_02900 [Erwinia mallotivora]|uniref:hypothetical protein n=1 Tax=Erwinia mallotivora TaxID=69222 RepID=UPI0035EA523B
MPIESIRNNTLFNINDTQLMHIGLTGLKNDLSKNISDIKNSVTKLNKSITKLKKNISGNQSLLKSLQSVSAKHGENASVRLKNDHFKYGQAGNFFKNIFHGNRYQTEREAAVKMVNAEGSTVSAAMVINTLQSKIDSALSKVNGLRKEIAEHNKKINGVEKKNIT